MDDVNNIIPGVAGAAGTGAVMIGILKMFLSNWLAKADKTSELVSKIDKDLAVLDAKVINICKDLDGVANALRREVAALQK